MSKDRDRTGDEARLAPDDSLVDSGDLAADDGRADESEQEIVAEFGPEPGDLVVEGDGKGVDDVVELPAELADDADQDDDGLADDELDADAVPATAAAGSNRTRAAARTGSSRVAATTAKKSTATRPRDTTEDLGVFAKLGRFVREVVAELRKVIWPSRRQWATFTLVVIVFLVVMTALVSGLDVLFHLVVGKIFG